MDLDKTLADHLAAWGRTRRGWDKPGCLAQLAKVKGRSADDVAMAWVRFCADDAARNPGAFPSFVGPHWSEKVAPAKTPTPPKPAEACRTCGRHMHAADATCDTPTLRPVTSTPPPVTYLDARRRPTQGEPA